jgi:hypothetical protein
MSDPRERLTRLVELATQNAPEKRRMLATELCDLLLDWPENYPPAMREPFETLLEKTMRLIDREARHALIARIAAADHVTLDFLNEFFFEAPADLRQTILSRNAAATAPSTEPCAAIDEAALIDAARSEVIATFTARFAQATRIDSEIAERILRDASASSLAIAAKGAHLSRAAFSAIALLADGARAPDEIVSRLAAYDGVCQDGAENMLRFWRMRAPQRLAQSA